MIDKSIFETAKQTISTREAAEHFGLKVKRNGMVFCPFHEDKTPSMKLDRRFHCFGCGADGDVIDFTARLFGLSQYDAAKKLVSEFQLSNAIPTYPMPDKEREAKTRKMEKDCISVLLQYEWLLKGWKAGSAPKTPGEEPDVRYVEACQNLAYTEYLLDELFLETEDQAKSTAIMLADDPWFLRVQHRLKQKERMDAIER